MRSWGVMGALIVSIGLGSPVWAQQPAPQPGGQPGPGMGSGTMMMGGMGHQGGMGMGQGQPGMMMGHGGSRMMMGDMGAREGSRFDRPLISLLLRHREMFHLTPEQEQRLRALRADYEKDVARGEAEVRVAEVDLREMLAAEAPDLSKIEAQVKRIAALQGELRFRRIRTLQAGLALLTKEQRQQLDRHLDHMGMMGGGMGPGMMGGGMMGPPGPGMGPRQPAPPRGGAGPEPQR